MDIATEIETARVPDLFKDQPDVKSTVLILVSPPNVEF